MRRAALILLALAVSACGLPRSGPYYEELTAERDAAAPAFRLIDADAAAVAAANRNRGPGFPPAFVDAAPEDTARLGPGDRLQVTVWERGDSGLYAPLGGPTALKVKVEETGRIYLPYLGEVRAAGRTAAGLRQAIAAALSTRTLDPQVEIWRETGESKSVTITGSAGLAAVAPIEPNTATLLGMLAKAGAAFDDPDTVTVTLRRGAEEGRIWLREAFETPEYDVALRAGDRIFLDIDDRHFRALGAVGQARVAFPTRDITLLDALALVGGLNANNSDPRGVFLFRRDAGGGEPDAVVYLFDLSAGGGLLLADAMMMRDGDLVYVTDAPFTRFRAVAGAVAATIGFAGSVGALQTAVAAQ